MAAVLQWWPQVLVAWVLIGLPIVYVLGHATSAAARTRDRLDALAPTTPARHQPTPDPRTKEM